MGWFRKINKNGEDYKPIGNVITATSLSVTGPDLADGDVVRVMFTTDIAGSDTSTPLALTWNGGATPIPVKAMKNGSLVGMYAIEYAANLYRYISAYATLELVYDEANAQFVVVGNPVVLSGSNYTIYADGKVGDTPIGVVQATFDTTAPLGWLLLQGQTISRTEYAELLAWATARNLIGTGKPFGAGDGTTTFVLPDCREATLKGAGLTSKSANHYDADGLALGEFIDDRLQNHTHDIGYLNAYYIPGGDPQGYTIGRINTEGSLSGYASTNPPNGRTGATTEVKAVGVNYIIKAM